MDVLVAKYINNEVNLHFEGHEFVPGRNEYFLNWTFKQNDAECYFNFKVTPTTSQLPAMRIGPTNIDTSVQPFYYVMVVPPTLITYIRMAIGASTGTSTGILSITLEESGGDSTLLNAIEFNSTNTGIVANLVGTVAEMNIDITIDADFPIFASDWQIQTPLLNQVGDAYGNDDYQNDNDRVINCVSGDMSSTSEALNYLSIADTIPRNKIYYIYNRLKKNGTIIETKRNEFQIAPDGRIWLVAPQHSSTGQSYNMTLYMQGTGMTFKHRTPGSPWTVEHLLTPTLSKYYYGEWTNYNNGDFYNTINNTNIPIFADTATGDAYGDGLIGEDMALNAGELEDRRTTTGSDLESTDIPNITVGASGIGCNVWALDRGNLNSIMSILFDDDQTIIDDIKKGTWLWGNNPADFIISCYFVPFAITNFYDTTTERVYLGFYDTNLDYTRVKESKSSGQRITLVNTTIDSVYGDWRDYTNFKYEIYLPYVGFYPLDVMSYLNKTLTVEMAFDIMTHNIRYYLFANGKIVDRVDGSVGYDIPLMATDQVNKAKSDLSGITNVVKGGVELAGGVATGNIGMLAKGGMDTFKGVQSGFAYPKQEIVGNVSSSMNIYDINYCYLKITEKDTLKPDKLNTIYNYPSYFIGNVSELSGYTIIDDLQFSCTGTSEEINEILSLLRGGAIL